MSPGQNQELTDLSGSHGGLGFDGERARLSSEVDDDVLRLLELEVVVGVQDHSVGQRQGLRGALSGFHHHHREAGI